MRATNERLSEKHRNKKNQNCEINLGCLLAEVSNSDPNNHYIYLLALAGIKRIFYKTIYSCLMRTQYILY